MALITSEALASQIGVTARTLCIWRKQGRGPAYSVIEGLIRYDEDVVAAWLASAKGNTPTRRRIASKTSQPQR